jgi:hypothetical protein
VSAKLTSHIPLASLGTTSRICAAMLGRLRIPLDQTIERFVQLSKDVFSDKKPFSTSGSPPFKLTKLRQALKDTIREATGDENEKMIDRQPDAGRCMT